MDIHQGEIYRIENVKELVLVVSKDFFNQDEKIMGCAIVANAKPDPLHIPIITNEVRGIVLCEQIKYFDLKVRGYQKISEVNLLDKMNITDAIQSIFDYF